MTRSAHPHAMQPRKAGRTRTAPPRMPAQFPFSGRYRNYVLFDGTGLVYLLMGLLVLRVVWALGTGQPEWDTVIASFQSPLYLAFHALVLVSVVFVGVRFFRLFPKAQPPRIGPAKPPPQPALVVMLYGVWAGATVVLAAILAGVLF